jgi:phosphopantothenate synthetase
MINVCRSCTYYNINDNIVRALQHIQTTAIDGKMENSERLVEHSTEYFGGFMSNDELSEMIKYIKFITNSSNKVIQGLPYILH